MPLTAQQLSSNLDLGVVVIEDEPTDATGRIELTDREPDLVARDKEMLRSTVTMISMDGMRFQGFDVSASGWAFLDPDDPGPPYTVPLLSGEWFVTIGSEGLIPWTMLRDALRDGKAAELEAAGVPKLVIEPGEHLEVTISAEDAWNALKSVVPEPGS